MKRRALLAAPFACSGCSLFRRRHQPPPPAAVHYVLGPPYQAGGVWRYPRAQFDYDATGLAQAFGPQGRLCTDGAPYDPTALLAAHATLQLPSVALVTNLETGLQVVVRIDCRGPASPARLLALTPRVMALLGPGTEPGVLRVRVQIQEAPSRALADALQADRAPRLAIAVAPQGTVQAQTLAPPPGTAAEAGGTPAGPGPARPLAAAAAPAPIPLRLPETVTRVQAQPGSLFVLLGSFTQPRYARQMAARLAGLGAAASADCSAPRDQAFRVRIGPLAGVAQAEATLDQALRAGVVDARIVVDQE